jgi:hypothetical protein
MKYLLLYVIGFGALGYVANGQITLEHTYSLEISDYSLHPNARFINLEKSGKKILFIPDSTKIELYNTDHTIWKTINIPRVPGYKPQYMPVGLISERLFDLDDKIEYVHQVVDNSGNLKLLVYNETGDLVHDFGTYKSNIGVPMLDLAKDNDGKFKLLVKWFTMPSGAEMWHTGIYSLPGSIPCADDCGQGGTLGTDEINSMRQFGSEAIPNPSQDKVTITYQLPSGVASPFLQVFSSGGQLMKTVQLDRFAERVTISNAGLPTGAYYYHIVADGKQVSSGKMVLLR